MGSVFDPDAGRYVRSPGPPARRSNPAIPGRSAPPPVPPPVPPPERPEPVGHRAPAPARARRWPMGLVLVAMFVGGLGIGGLVRAVTADEPAPASAPPLPVYREGTHIVGDAAGEMSAGRYVTAGPVGDADCTTVRLSRLDGGPDGVVAERTVEGPTTLRVIRADAGVVLEGSCTWRMG